MPSRPNEEILGHKRTRLRLYRDIYRVPPLVTNRTLGTLSSHIPGNKCDRYQSGNEEKVVCHARKKRTFRSSERCRTDSHLHSNGNYPILMTPMNGYRRRCA